MQLEKGNPIIADFAGNISSLAYLLSTTHLPSVFFFLLVCYCFAAIVIQHRQNERRDERLRILLPSLPGYPRPPILLLALYLHQRLSWTLHILWAEIPCARKEKKAFVARDVRHREEYPQEEINGKNNAPLPHHLLHVAVFILFYGSC